MSHEPAEIDHAAADEHVRIEPTSHNLFSAWEL